MRWRQFGHYAARVPMNIANEPLTRKAARLLAACGLLATLGACTAYVRGAPLASKPTDNNPRKIFLSTGGAGRPYKTVGFVQATGFGNQVAGVIDIGDAGLDSTIHGAIVDAAVRLGGHGVINIEFLDMNPQTPAERAGDLAKSLGSLSTNEPQIETRWRSVVATGEVIQFLN